MRPMPFHQFPMRLPAEAKPFADGLKEKKLLLMRCKACGHVRMPPALICPKCHETAHEWFPACGEGSLYSFVVFHRAFHPALEQCLPYVTAQVRLLEGPLFITNIVNCHPDMLYCDQSVRLFWENSGAEGFFPAFAPAEHQDG